MSIKVRATQTGYYGINRYRAGQEFEIADEKDFSKNWMEKVDLLGDVQLEPKEDEVEEEVDPHTGEKARRPRRHK